MNLTLEERETIITFNEKDGTAECFTYNGKLTRRLNELCQSRPEECAHTRNNGNGGQFFIFPKAWVKITPPRILSEAQAQALAAARAKAR